MTIESLVKSNKRLRKFIEPFYWWTLAFGINIVKFIRAFRWLPSILRDYYLLRKSSGKGGG
jgi:hypothetical protein